MRCLRGIKYNSLTVFLSTIRNLLKRCLHQSVLVEALRYGVTIFVLCIKVQTLASGPGISGSSGGNIICDGSAPISSYRSEIKDPLNQELLS